MSNGKGGWPRSFSAANAERCALINKKYTGGLQDQLSAEEIFRLHLLDTIVGAWINYKFPPNYAKLAEWQALADRLESEENGT